MSFSLGNEGLHPFGKNLAEQLDATRHMRQTQIDDVSCWRYGFIGSAKTNFVAIEIRQFRPMRGGATRFDNAAWRDIFLYPKLCFQPRIIVETLANQITAKAVVNRTGRSNARVHFRR